MGGHTSKCTYLEMMQLKGSTGVNVVIKQLIQLILFTKVILEVVWNKVFRIKKKDLAKLPPQHNLALPFLLNNPVEAAMIAKYTREHLDEFNIEDLIRHIEDVLIRNMAKYWLITAKILLDMCPQLMRMQTQIMCMPELKTS